MQLLYWVHFPHITPSIIRASLSKPHIGMYNNCILWYNYVCMDVSYVISEIAINSSMFHL